MHDILQSLIIIIIFLFLSVLIFILFSILINYDNTDLGKIQTHRSFHRRVLSVFQGHAPTLEKNKHIRIKLGQYSIQVAKLDYI